MKIARVLIVSVLLLISVNISAQPKAVKKDSSEAAVPKPVQITTHHSITIGGKEIKYTAVTGTFQLKNESDTVIALIGFTAYMKDGVTDFDDRPLTFAYNGGPGSSSMWLHMGAIGPKRVVLNDPNTVPPAPYKYEDNKYSILDVTDLVIIDPVGTGLSKPVGKAKGKDFWGVNEDIKSISEFIYQYMLENNRLNSPKFLLGESYGTTRSAGVSDFLSEKMGISLNGIIFVSTVFDFQTLIFSPGNDLPYILFLPTYAAVSWYHKTLPSQPKDLKAFINEVKNFAQHEYAQALFNGNTNDSVEVNKVVDKLYEYTGISKSYWKYANLRVSEPQFTAELLREKGKTVGRLDSRYTGPASDLLTEYSDYDPQSSAISPAFVATFLEYLHNDLKFPTDQSYHISAYANEDFKWNWNRQENGRVSPYQNSDVSQDLAEVMSKNPYLNVLMLNGYFDLATPFFATEYTMNHLGSNIPDIKERVHEKYFNAGHMMYINNESLPEFKSYISDFILKMSKPKNVK
jgi:carboxypeptidase C (cathepsin A)